MTECWRNRLKNLFIVWQGVDVAVYRSLYPVYRRIQRPVNGLDTNKAVEATKRPSKHGNMRRVRPRVEKEFRLDSNDFGFICVNESVK